jgi:hypothetical protein
VTFPLWVTFLVFVAGTILGFFAAAALCAGKDSQ